MDDKRPCGGSNYYEADITGILGQFLPAKPDADLAPAQEAGNQALHR
jgi:hypothetical protein